MNTLKKTQSDRFKLSYDERDTIRKIEILIQAVERVYPRTRVMIWRSFLHGVFVALGATIGLSIVFAVLTFLITQLKTVPVVNDIINETQIERVIPTKP